MPCARNPPGSRNWDTAPFRTLALVWRRGSFADGTLRQLGAVAAKAFRQHPDGM